MRFQTGDVVLEKGESPLSEIVQKVTHSPYSHVAMIYEYPVIIHAHALGVHLREIQSLDTIDIIRKKGGLSHTEKKKLKKVALEIYIGKEYDVTQFMGLGKYFDHPELMICSELIDDLFNELNYNINPDKKTGKITPKEIKTDFFKYIYKNLNAKKLKYNLKGDKNG